MVKKISMDINETLELDYVIEQITNDVVEITDEPSPDALSLTYISREASVLNPTEPGIYKLDIKGQTIEIEVTDIPDSGVSRWTFDDSDTNSGTAVDVWGNTDGTINGATTGDSGISNTYDSGEAYSFDANDYVDLNFSTLQVPFTVALWFRPANVPANTFADIFSNFNSGSNDFYLDQINGSDDLRFVWDDAGVNIDPISANLTADSPTHVIITGTGSSVQTYIDGSSAESATHSTSADVSNGKNFYIAGAPYGVETEGDVDDVRIYDKALTSTEANDLYNTGSI